MTVIVNDRDVLLQGTSPRVEQVGLPSNVAIDPANVPGLSAAFDATKEVSLSSTSQVFVVPKIGAIQPASIEITALLKSITGTPTFTLLDGSVSFTNNGNKITIASGSMNSNTATIQVSVLFNSITYTDTITIGKIAEGSDAVVGLLSNESCTVAASDLGVVSGAVLATAGGTFNVFDGIINKTTSGSVAFSVLNETGCDLSINSSGVYTVNSISANTGNATLRAIYTRGTTSVTIDKVYSVSKAIAGIIGSNAKLLYLSATSQIFQIPKSGTVTPSAITLTATAQNLDQAANYTWTTTPAMTLTAGAQSNIKTLNYSDMTGDTVKIDVTRDGLTDTITLVKVREGNDSIVGYLTNESVTVPADSSGTVSSYTGSGGTFEVYQGLTRLTGIGITYSVPSLSGCSVSINSSTGVYSVSGMSADFGTATLRASLVIAGTTINLDKVYTIAKSKAGQTGAGGSGTRGTVNISSSISGSSWTDNAAVSALSAAGYGAPQSRDIVTLYNTSTSFSESRFYSGSAWVTLDAYINGNLLVSRTVASAAIQTGAIGAEHISVGTGGKNMLQNSGPANNSAYGWVNGFNSTGQAFVSAPFLLAGYAPLGKNSVATHMNGSPGGNTVFDIHNDNFGKRYPVKAEQRYELSGYISIHRCSTSHMHVWWYNQAGSVIQEDQASAQFMLNDLQYNTSLTNWPRSVGFVTAPPGAVTAIVGPRTTVNGQSDPYCMVSMAYFGEATSGQTTFSAWSDGGTSMIGPGSIVTGNLSSISADIGAVRTGWVYGTVISGGAGYDTSAYSWPHARGLGNSVGGFHLSSSGLLLGNPGGGNYFYANADGTFGGPTFSCNKDGAYIKGRIEAESGYFRGDISAATGNISGTATIGNAQVGTFSIAGNAVTVPISFAGDSGSFPNNPSGQVGAGVTTGVYPNVTGYWADYGSVFAVINWVVSCPGNATNTGVSLVVDGTVVSYFTRSTPSNFTTGHSACQRLNLSPGYHNFSLYFYNNAGSGLYYVVDFQVVLIGTQR